MTSQTLCTYLLDLFAALMQENLQCLLFNMIFAHFSVFPYIFICLFVSLRHFQNRYSNIVIYPLPRSVRVKKTHVNTNKATNLLK